MRSPRLLVAAALAAAVTLIGCDKARPLPTQGARPSGCVSCHGGELDSTGAPPYSLPRNASGTIIASGNRLDHTAATTRIEVGAHTAHLQAGVSCGSCHMVPATVGSPGHNTGNRATVVFKELAAAGNVVPTPWDPAVHTCTNYCHGASLAAGGTNHAPDWLGGPAAAACGSCHFAAGVTPPVAHPQGTGTGGSFANTAACAGCHPDTINVDGTINLAGGKHVNGVLDGGGGHSAGFADPAQHGPAANSGLQNCTACHGADFAGNGVPAKSCNACHATNGHPNWRTECTFCHGDAARAADITFPSAGIGTVVRANQASPPLGSQGENSITAYAVGAHQAHVGGGPFARASQCSECHGPTLPADLTHVNGQIVLGWGPTASNGIVPTPVAAGNYPRWSLINLVPPASATCTNFCHGATLAGGTNKSPNWVEGASGATCGSCHEIPLPYTAAGGWHVQRQDCSACHPGYTNDANVLANRFVNVADHIFVGAGPQGLTCTSCHGSRLANAAPPGDINGGADPNRVGAHQKHVAGVTLHQGNFACTECHPDNGTNTRHANGVVNIVWGPTASANGTYAVAPATGTISPGSVFPGCTNYCHSPRPADAAAGLVPAPLWTATGTVVCGSCHGLPPLTSAHPSGATACGSCHDGYANGPSAASDATAVSLVNHINGVVNVKAMSCTACHGDATRAGVSGADPLVKVAPPVAANGATTGNQVGAHLAHVNQGSTATPGALSSPFPCTTCHTGLIYTAAPHGVPASPVVFGNLAVDASAVPSYTVGNQTCASTYCHGNFSGGNGVNSIAWTAAGKLACTACHGTPPAIAAHPANSACGNCHPGYTISTVNPATHVNGQIDGGESSGATPCLNCHKTDAATGAKYNLMVSDTTVYHHVLSSETGGFVPYPLTATGRACLQCHADHDVFNPALNAANTLGRGANLRTTIATAPTKVAPASGSYANTDFSGTAGVCLSCHSAAIAKAAGQKSDGSTATHPVDGTSFAASAHAYTVAGSFSSGPSAFTANCVKCHSDQQTATYPDKQNGTYKFALHTSVDRRLRNPMGQVTPNDDKSEDHCFRCHSLTTDTSPGGGPAKTIANRDYFNSVAMTVSSQNVFTAFSNTHVSRHNVAAYDLIHQPTEAPAGAGGVKHVECEDCHEPHAAKAGAKPASNSNLVWGPITGVTGVVPTWSTVNFTAPTGYTATTASSTEYQICFKCHSGANTGLATWGAGDWTDVALEFSPANKSRHPVASALNAAGSGSTVLAASQLANGWAPGNVMTCSDCHGADAASPAAQGPHGSAVKYMLHGTNRAWPYTTAGASTGTLFTMSNTATNYNAANGNGLFCRNCHGDPAGTSTVTNAGHVQFDGQHGTNAISTCVRCHLRVPHGGKVSRLIATSPNTPARYQVSGQTLNLVHFVKNNAGTYSGSSWFGTTCTKHASGAATGEAW